MKRITYLLFLSFFLLNSMASTATPVGLNAVGTPIGTPGAWGATTNTFEKALDGDLNTFFDSNVATGAWVGLGLPTNYKVTQIKFAPRKGFAQRMVGGRFEGATNANFGRAKTIFTIAAAPTESGLTTVDLVDESGFTYIRYIGPAGGSCNVAEVQFWGEEAPVYEPVITYTQLTNLPTIYIDTDNYESIESKEIYVTGKLKIVDASRTTGLYDGITEIRGRGNSTWTLEKKPYRIKLDKKTSLFDLPAKEKSWVLLANYGDKSLLRNALAFEASRRIGVPFSPSTVFVDVVLNGDFLGNYLLTDQMEVATGRVQVESQKVTDTELPNLSGGYFLEADGWANLEPVWFKTNRNVPVTIKYPKDDEINSAQKAYIASHFQVMEDALFSPDYANQTAGYRNYMDETSWAKFILINELCGNSDAFFSIYMSKLRNDQKIYAGPVWDFDIAFSNDDRLGDATQKWMYVDGHGDGVAGSWIRRLFEDPAFKAKLKTIWKTLKESGEMDGLLDYLAAQKETLAASQALNFNRWDILGKKIFREVVVHQTYDQEVEYVRNYFVNRIAFLDAAISKFPDESSAINQTAVNGLSFVVVGETVTVSTTDAYSRELTLNLLNMQGQLLYTQKLTPNELSIQLPALPVGVYLLQLQTSQTQLSSLFVKQ